MHQPLYRWLELGVAYLRSKVYYKPLMRLSEPGF